MRILVAAVGRARKGPERTLFEHFAGRLGGSVQLMEIEEKKPLPAARLKRREGELLLARVPDGAVVVALDSTGRDLTSRAFADQLRAWRDDGVRDLAFLIGGAEGLDAGLLADADLVLSLGPMTWPHLLVRALLAEQLYRAHSILDGHPYHRG